MPEYFIDGFTYLAIPMSENVWMVKKYTGPIKYENPVYVEALITVHTDDPEVAVKAAIARGSWA